MSQVIDTAFEKQAGDVEAVASTLETVADNTDSIITKYTILRDELEALGEKYPDIKPAVSSVVAKLNTSIAKQTALRDDLRTSAKELRSGAKDLATAKKEIDALLSKSVKGISKVKADYEKNVMNDLKSLSSSLSKTGSSMKKLLSQLDKSVTSIKDLTDTATEDLQKIRLSLDTSGKLLNKASGRVDDLVSKLEKMQQTGDFSELKDLFADKNDELSAFLAKPVSLKTTKVYEIENYGSSMAPFYSTLAIWIGGIIMVALMSVAVPGKRPGGTFRDKEQSPVSGKISDLPDTGAGPELTDWSGRSVLSGHTVQAPVPVHAGVLDIQHRLCQYHIHTDGLLRGYRQGHKRHTAGDSGGGHWRNFPYRGSSEVLQDRVPYAAVHSQHGGTA